MYFFLCIYFRFDVNNWNISTYFSDIDRVFISRSKHKENRIKYTRDPIDYVYLQDIDRDRTIVYTYIYIYNMGHSFRRIFHTFITYHRVRFQSRRVIRVQGTESNRATVFLAFVEWQSRNRRTRRADFFR